MCGSRLSTRYQEIEGYILKLSYLYSMHVINIINILLDAKINGYVLLNLDESTLKQFGVSFGFQFTLTSIIKELVCDS